MASCFASELNTDKGGFTVTASRAPESTESGGFTVTSSRAPVSALDIFSAKKVAGEIK